MKKLLEFQKRVEVIKKDAKNPFFKSNYFDINSLLAEIKPILNDLGLVLLQPLEGGTDNNPCILTIIYNGETGEKIIASKFPLPNLQDPQKMGSAITYYRRYALQSLLALQAEDDDANTASNNSNKEKYEQKASTKETQQNNLWKIQIQKFLDANSSTKLSTKEDYEKFCLNNLGIELKEENYEEIINLINNN